MVFNVCPACGMYAVERSVEVLEGERAITRCDSCGAEIPFRRSDLYVVTGASGVGKTTTCRALIARASEFTVLESDILWGAVPAEGEDGVGFYWNAWLRMIKNLNQTGQTVILCGTLDPRVLEPQPERRYIGAIHCLALTAEPEEQTRRLKARPAWRESGNDEFVASHVAFNQWLIEHATDSEPGWAVHDTTNESVEATADFVLAWARHN